MSWECRDGPNLGSRSGHWQTVRFGSSFPRLLAQPRQPALTSARRKTIPVSLRDLVIKDAKDKTSSSNHRFLFVDLISSILNYLQHNAKPFNICCW